MTLCVAWRFQDRISIASDSRITAGESGYADIGVKILEWPVRIITAQNAHDGAYEELHRSTIGVGISGSFLSAYMVTEQLAHVLRNFQYMGDRSTLTFATIAAAAFKFYLHAVEQLNGANDFGFDADMLLVGRCPATQRLAGAKFFRDHDEQIKNVAILENDRSFVFDAIGAGDTRLKERIQARLAAGPCRVDYMVLEELRAMIVGNEVECVGGPIQYGKIENQDFEIFGVQDHRWDDGQAIPMPSVRGINARQILGATDPSDLHLRERRIVPFDDLLFREMQERESRPQ